MGRDAGRSCYGIRYEEGVRYPPMERGANPTTEIDDREIRERIERGYINRSSREVFDGCGANGRLRQFE